MFGTEDDKFHDEETYQILELPEDTNSPATQQRKRTEDLLQK